MLSGTADLALLAEQAPRMPSLGAGPVELGDAVVVQAAFEMGYASRQPLLPPGLHPTTPPLMVVLAWSVGDSPWGAFQMAQVRVSCRSGVRPRGFVTGCLVSTSEAATALAEGWGLPARVGPVRLERYYDSVELRAGEGLALTGADPDPLGPGDVQYTVTTTLAHTERGLRLVQVEPDYTLARVERLRPRLGRFEAAGWGSPLLAPRSPVIASVAVGAITLPAIRFVSRPDVLAFEGTEPVAAPG